MKTNVRAEVSDKNEYALPKHRYLELKHFCLQYPEWEQRYAVLDGLAKSPTDMEKVSKTNNISNPTEKCAEAMDYFMSRMRMVEQVAKEVSPDLWRYLILGVTRERPYEFLKMKKDIPCGRETYYKLYRKFFWLLNQARE